MLNKKSFKVPIVILFILISGMLYSCRSQDEPFTEIADTDMLMPESDGMVQNSKAAVEETQKRLYVYVCGSVRKPGVYEFDKGARAADAIEAAGGMTGTAAKDILNLAAPLQDGARIYVPSEAELENGIFKIEDTAGESLININTADENQLMTLPGIGEAKARHIIDYRESHGSFETIEALKNVPGIKAGVYDGLVDLITVG